MIRALVACTFLVLLVGCQHARPGVAAFYPPGRHPPVASGPGPHVTMHYLGTGGWVIRYDDAVIVTAPFFSRPRGVKVYLPGGTDPERVNEGLKGVELSDVTAILLGHSHYDHAMDLQYILNEKATCATLYGSKTVKHLFTRHITPRKDGPTVVDVTPDPKAVEEIWWVTRSSPSSSTEVRFKALPSDHAPHALHFLRLVSVDTLSDDAASLPETPAAWPQGETLAYLIDFMKNGDVVFRIYYQDSAAPPGKGVPSIRDGRPIDVAILSVASFSQVPESPRSILRAMGPAGPRYIVGGHWEDFFSSSVEPWPRVATFTDLEDFVGLAREAATHAPIFIPAPRETLTFPVR